MRYCLIYYQANQPVASNSGIAGGPITYQYNVTMGGLRAIFRPSQLRVRHLKYNTHA